MTFWIDTAKMVERVEDPPWSSKDCEHLSGKRRIQAELWLELSRGLQYNGIDDCHQAIREGVAGRKKEKWCWLRTFTWYESTNAFRTISEFSFPVGTKCDLQERHLENLTELALLIDGSSEANRLELIEIHRQRGDFSSANTLLDFEWSKEAMSFVEYLGKLVANEDMILRRVPKQTSDGKTLAPEN